MNLMVCLIPLLLSTAKLNDMSLLQYLPPAAAEEGGGGGGEDQSEQSAEKEQTLNLLVNIVDEAIQVSMFNKVEAGPHFYEIPKLPDGGFNYDALKDSLWSIKQNEVGASLGLDSTQDVVTQEWTTYPKYKYKDGREVSITAVGTTDFQTVVRVMDACRIKVVDNEEKELFPIAILKQFQ